MQCWRPETDTYQSQSYLHKLQVLKIHNDLHLQERDYNTKPKIINIKLLFHTLYYLVNIYQHTLKKNHFHIFQNYSESSCLSWLK